MNEPEQPDVAAPPAEKGEQRPVQQEPITRSSGDDVPPPGPEREPAEEKESGVEAADPEARTPRGVGKSVGRRGEDAVKREGKERGRTDTGTAGKAQRPTGTSDHRDSTGIQGQQTLDEQSPHQPRGGG